MSGPLAGKVCIVTGASRGIGKGIALQLGEAGATVYITGRTLTAKKDGVGGSLTDTAEEIEGRGGKCIPVQCDHSNDEDVKKFFDRVKTEQNGRLDLLVNNAYSGVTCDRMASECAIDLKKHNVAYVSLWPGAVRTEHLLQMSSEVKEDEVPKEAQMMKKLVEIGETPEFAGKAVVHLATDPNIMKKTGKIIHTTWIANEFGFNDTDGRHHLSPFSFKYFFTLTGHSWLAAVTPEFLRFPAWLVWAGHNRF